MTDLHMEGEGGFYKKTAPPFLAQKQRKISLFEGGMEMWGEIISLLWDIFILRLLWRNPQNIWKLGQEPRKEV